LANLGYLLRAKFAESSFTHSGRKRASWFSCTKHDELGGAVPRRATCVRRRAIGVGESLENAEDTFAQWRGYTVTYPTKYKRLRAPFPCRTDRGRCRALGTDQSVESPEDAFAEWHGCARIDAQVHKYGGQVPCLADRRRRRAVRIVTNLAKQGDSRWRIQENLQPEAIPFLLCL
jgi:hypothetical protein